MNLFLVMVNKLKLRIINMIASINYNWNLTTKQVCEDQKNYSESVQLQCAMSIFKTNIQNLYNRYYLLNYKHSCHKLMKSWRENIRLSNGINRRMQKHKQSSYWFLLELKTFSKFSVAKQISNRLLIGKFDLMLFGSFCGTTQVNCIMIRFT